MSAPVLSVPPSYPIAARPRRSSFYDTEVFTAASTISFYSFFQSATTFLQPGFGHKTPLDTNYPGPGGSLPRGYYFRWFGLQSYLSQRQIPTTTAAEYDAIRAIVNCSYAQVMLGQTPYMTLPGVPEAGTGLMGPLASGEPVTIGGIQQGWPTPQNYVDLAVPGTIQKHTPRGVVTVRVPRVPIELAETESFGVNVVFPTRPSVTNPVYITLSMIGIKLKPLTA